MSQDILEVKKDFEEAVKQNPKTIFVCIILIIMSIGGAFVFLWSEYKDVNNQRTELYKEQASFEKIKNEKNNEFFVREQKLLEKEKELEVYSNNNQAKLKTTIDVYNEKLEEVKKLDAKYSENARKYEIENKINDLTEQFSNLGVDLDYPNWCDKDYTKRYNQASGILSQISSLSRTYNLPNSFVAEKSSHKIFINEGVCNQKVHIIK